MLHLSNRRGEVLYMDMWFFGLVVLVPALVWFLFMRRTCPMTGEKHAHTSRAKAWWRMLQGDVYPVGCTKRCGVRGGSAHQEANTLLNP